MKAKPSIPKRIIYNLILVLIPVIILLFFEVLLRIFGYGDNLNLFINYPEKPFREYKINNPEIGRKYFQKLEYTRPCNDMFLKEKPENGFRIFVMGSSTVIGFPYSRNLMFSRILHDRLQDSYPGKHIEVVNTAITAINSFTLCDYIDYILKESPDAIIIYAGHNEFYGAFGVGSNESISKYRRLTFLHLDLLSLRLYQLLRNTIAGLNKVFSGKNADQGVHGTLMKRIASNKEIIYHDKVYNTGIELYRKNMGEIIEKANKKGVPVFISDLISNIKDLKPFCSIDAGGNPPAKEMYDKGQEFEKAGDYAQAKEYYYRAKDLDCIRFRASEEINEVIYKLAAQPEVYLVPMKAYFEKRSPNGLIGNNLLTEHVHPNIDGYFLMADAFFSEIAGSQLIGEKISILNYKPSEYYQINWGYTKLDSLHGLHRIKNLSYHWPFQPFDAPYIDYRNIYKPVSLVDSLAFKALISPGYENIDAHEELAEYYDKQQDFYASFKEYYSMVKNNPYIAEYYLKAARSLIKIDDFPLALELLNRSLELQETFFGYYTMGEILLIKGDFTEAVEAFNNASQFVTEKYRQNLLLKQLEAYYFSGQRDKAGKTLEQIRLITPGYKPDFSKLRVQYTQLVPFQVKDQIQLAMNYYRQGNYDSALDEVLKSLHTKETSFGNRLAGEILLRSNDKKAFLYFLKAYPDYKKDLVFLYNLGILYVQNGMIQKAQNTLIEMKQLNPDYQNIPRLERLIQSYNYRR